jgi:hypothetical protein
MSGMYSTCLFCHTSLGKNEAIEHFPVGRRLAFDAAKGRLWVVCGACERWNLTPLEERWEAIEECERAFRDTKLRVSTDNVGLARLREGTTLVRIGDPQRPELAAWRYGDQFGRRRQRYGLVSAAVIAGVGGVLIAGPLGLGLIGGGTMSLVNVFSIARGMRSVARINVRAERYGLNLKQLYQVELLPNDEFGYELYVPFMQPWSAKINNPFSRSGQGVLVTPPLSVTLTGDQALRAARTLLPRINAAGGTGAAVREAVDLLEATPRAGDLFARLAGPQRAHGWWNVPARLRRFESHHTLKTLPVALRLALEMTLHEEDERRALEGELATLEARWKEAEEIAAISDDMFLPPGIMDRFRRLKDG